jgi:iron complex outermembrane recepter protein
MKYPSLPRALLKATPLAAAVAAAWLPMAPVHAQQAASAGTETVTITGIRRGIESAINVKKNADSIVESISSEDIGKLPDSSIAESIARVPGVAVAFRVTSATRCSTAASRSPPATTAASNSTSTPRS